MLTFWDGEVGSGKEGGESASMVLVVVSSESVDSLVVLSSESVVDSVLLELDDPKVFNRISSPSPFLFIKLIRSLTLVRRCFILIHTRFMILEGCGLEVSFTVASCKIRPTLFPILQIENQNR